MFKFLKNLFNLGKKKQNGNTYIEDDCEIIINKSKGNMVIKTNRVLTDDEIINLFKKYILKDGE